ncbi:MAG: hypothetical protein K8H90_02790 [Thermoanaerobaculia bacterium]|nr:hypothetical protein [Thermoanaerobaculia bacterium]
MVVAQMRSFGHRPSSERVDEVVQECFLRMLASRTFNRESCRRTLLEAEGYFRRVARAVLVDEIRGNRAAKRGGERIVHVECEGLAEARASSAPDPEAVLVEKDSHQSIARRLRRALAPTHSPRDCHLLEAVVLDEERPCDLARKSRGTLSAGAAYIALHRMRRHLIGLGREELLS